MMGSGKSTIGTLLARRTGWPYFDNDDLVEQLGEMTARELLADVGAVGLRSTEGAALRLGLTKPAPAIIAAAAGTILEEENRRALRESALVVWLDAGPKTLARRARGGAHRPFLDNEPEDWMRSTLRERAPLYKQTADLTVSTQQRRPAGIATVILDWLADRVECAVPSRRS